MRSDWRWPVAGLFAIALPGCALEPATVTQRDAAACIQEAVQSSGHVSVVEVSVYPSAVDIAFRYASDAGDTRIRLQVADWDGAAYYTYYQEETPQLAAVNDLLKRRCPAVKLRS